MSSASYALTGAMLAIALASSCGPVDTGSSTANTTERNNNRQLDRMGHVEVGPLIIADLPVADRWNREEPFALDLPSAARSDYQAAIQKGLTKFDHYDSYPLSLLDLQLDALILLGEKRSGETPSADLLDWFDDVNEPHPLTAVYMTDALFVDVSKPCSDAGYVQDGEGRYTIDYAGGYLEPEMATLQGKPYKTCGGRMPNEDVIDRMATLLINGPVEREAKDPEARYPNRGDDIREPYKRTSDTFPYLMAPYADFEEGWF